MSDPFPERFSISINFIIKLEPRPGQELCVLGCRFVTNKDIVKHFIGRGRITLLSFYNVELLLLGVRGVVVTTGFIAVWIRELMRINSNEDKNRTTTGEERLDLLVMRDPESWIMPEKRDWGLSVGQQGDEL